MDIAKEYNVVMIKATDRKTRSFRVANYSEDHNSLIERHRQVA